MKAPHLSVTSEQQLELWGGVELREESLRREEEEGDVGALESTRPWRGKEVGRTLTHSLLCVQRQGDPERQTGFAHAVG